MWRVLPDQLIVSRISYRCPHGDSPASFSRLISSSSFAYKYRQRQPVSLRLAREALNINIVALFKGKTQLRSFSHHYRVKGRRHPPHQESATSSLSSIFNSLRIDTLLLSAHRRSYSALYRKYHVGFLYRALYTLSKPTLLWPHNGSRSTDANKFAETLSHRSFRHSYRERQFAPLLGRLPRDGFSRGMRHISSVLILTHLTESQGALKNKSRRFWLFRVFAAGVLIFMSLRLLEQRHDGNKLNDVTYVPFDLVEIEKISPTASIFSLRSKSEQPLDQITPVTSISIRDPNANIQRPYTVLSQTTSTIKILVKRYDNGELSRYVHSRKVGSELSIRQAESTYKLPEELPAKYILAVGGTGIAVAYQIVSYLVNLGGEVCPQIAVLHSSTAPEEVYLRKEFDVLKQRMGNNLQIQYFVDSDKTFLSETDIRGVYRHGASILVCGSDGFVAFVAGEKPEHMGQGHIGGLLKRAQITGNVWKL